MKIYPPISYILMFILVICVIINISGYYLYQQHKELQQENVELQERIKALDAAWAQCANRLTMCKETEHYRNQLQLQIQSITDMK